MENDKNELILCQSICQLSYVGTSPEVIRLCSILHSGTFDPDSFHFFTPFFSMMQQHGKEILRNGLLSLISLLNLLQARAEDNTYWTV